MGGSVRPEGGGEPSMATLGGTAHAGRFSGVLFARFRAPAALVTISTSRNWRSWGLVCPRDLNPHPWYVSPFWGSIPKV
jgi:hypothetical protein